MKEDLYVYDTLCMIFRDGRWGDRALASVREDSRAFVTNAVYGILSKNVTLEYIISSIAQKRPKNQISILLKMGLYYIDYMDSLPNYAAVDRIVECASRVGKGDVKGFINAVLRKYIDKGITYPKDKAENISVRTSTPLWLVKKYIEQYGIEQCERFLGVPKFTKQHIRPNLRLWNKDDLYSRLDSMNVDYVKSNNGCFISWSKQLYGLFDQGLITIQSPTSMMCCESSDVKDGMRVLDMCSAPGGKAVYLSELADITVKCCDNRQHRVDLIASYAERMKSSGIECVLSDATVFHVEYGAFDRVMCDVPCSGFGVAMSKPDIYLRRQESDISSLAAVQSRILRNAAKYVNCGGRIIYSTCTTLREENEDIVDGFIKDNNHFNLVSQRNFLPDGKGVDGFYIAVIERKA
ncbi:MAG: hypothetical protein K2M44_00680 [Clostridia bacterium]|nr:hypothetical protein [Clostridia bacterium]